MASPYNSAAPVIPGLHHVTAIAGEIQRHLRFYSRVLGLRLVKRTVNFDDPGTYHFYFGDTLGRPGTLLTFFPWEGAHPGRGPFRTVSLAVPSGSMGFWRRHLTAHGVPWREGGDFGQALLAFQDPDGLPLELVGVDRDPEGPPWRGGPIPAEHAVAGLHGIRAHVPDEAAAREWLTGVLGLVPLAREGRCTRLAPAGGLTAGGVYDLLEEPGTDRGRLGPGGVHHLALRARGPAAQAAWQVRLAEAGTPPTRVLDRTYFRSIYFHGPAGVLLEIATDGPGFTVDEAPDALGTTLCLPAHLEPRRRELERRLPALAPAA